VIAVRQTLLIIGVVAGCIDAAIAAARQQAIVPSNTDTRVRAIVASFSKSKHVTKVRRGVSHEKYKEVRSEPVVRSKLESLSGTYEAEGLHLELHLNVDANGRVSGSGEEQEAEGVTRSFGLSDGKVEGALLTATKRYPDGATQQLEGVFINMTSYDSPTDKGVTFFGLGVLSNPINISGLTMDKFFYRHKR